MRAASSQSCQLGRSDDDVSGAVRSARQWRHALPSSYSEGELPPPQCPQASALSTIARASHTAGVVRLVFSSRRAPRDDRGSSLRPRGFTAEASFASLKRGIVLLSRERDVRVYGVPRSCVRLKSASSLPRVARPAAREAQTRAGSGATAARVSRLSRKSRSSSRVFRRHRRGRCRCGGNARSSCCRSVRRPAPRPSSSSA